MADSDIVIKISGDTTEIERNFSDFQKGLEKNPPGAKSSEGFVDSWGKAFVVANQTLELFKKAFDFANQVGEFAKIGEAATAAGKRFEAVAQQAGLFPEKLLSGLEHVNAGMADMSDVLRVASGSLIELGANGGRITEIFDLATKASKVYGGTALQQFDLISNAIASGNTRSLKNIGIQLDMNKVTDDYARSLGVTSDFLNAQQKQQALLNAALEQGKDKFKTVNESLTPIADSMTRSKVATNNFIESLSKLFSATTTKESVGFFDRITNRLNSFSESIEKLIPNLKKFSESPMMNSPGVNFGKEAMFGAPVKSPVSGSEQFGPSSEPFLAAQKQMRAQTIALDEQQKQKLRDLQTKADDQMLADERAVYQEKWAMMMEDGLTKEESKQMLYEQNLLDEEAYQARLAEIEKEFLNLKSQDKETYNALVASADEKWRSDQEKRTREMNARMAADGKAAGMAIKNALVNTISQSIQTLVQNLMAGQNAFHNFTKLLLNLAGDLAIQLGTMFMATGIGMMALGEINPLTAILAGAGLIAVGTIMKGMAGGKATDASGGGGATDYATAASGASGGFGSPETDMTKPEERALAQTGVQVIVQGNILNNRESALEIANILNDSFDLNGTIVRANS